MTASVQKIYTTSSAGKNFEDLPPLLDRLEAVLIDIRLSPPTRPIVWSREYLKLLLKNRYLHVAALGNRSFKEGQAAVQNLGLGMKTVIALHVNLLLMCNCEDFDKCHRRIITNEFKKDGFIVGEIETWEIDKQVST